MSNPVLSYPRFVERVPLANVPGPVAIILSLSGVALATGLRWALDPVLPPGFPFVTFFPVVLVSAFLFGPRIGLLTGVASGLAAWYIFLPPPFSFVLNNGAAVALGFFIFIVSTEILLIHWMQRAAQHLLAERETSARLAETRELLFLELQHRVSNNLQMVGGLLSLQKRGLDDPAARAVIDEASRRLGLIGRISRQLYDPQGAGRDMAAFLDALTADVIEASGRSGIRHRIDATGEAEVAPEAAVPLALAVAEAVANAIEHGFADRDEGTIVVRLSSDAARITVDVVDDGRGLPPGHDAAAGSNLGLRIASLLTGQLGGHFSLHDGPDRGAVARIDLPRAPHRGTLAVAT